jgi:hypothetical protein
LSGAVRGLARPPAPRPDDYKGVYEVCT